MKKCKSKSACSNILCKKNYLNYANKFISRFLTSLNDIKIKLISFSLRINNFSSDWKPAKMIDSRDMWSNDLMMNIMKFISFLRVGKRLKARNWFKKTRQIPVLVLLSIISFPLICFWHEMYNKCQSDQTV